MTHDLIAACRRWAGFSLDQLCASCGNPFYCSQALPVCYGCRRSDARASLLAVLRARADSAPPAGRGPLGVVLRGLLELEDPIV